MSKITFDIDTWYPWQKDMITAITSTKELKIMAAGRQVGKSTYSSQAYKRLHDDIFCKPVEALICDTGTVYGARYYTVEPVGGSWHEMANWCYETFGDGGEGIWGDAKAPEPANRWYANSRKFWFRDVKDRDWFVLKWNS